MSSPVQAISGLLVGLAAAGAMVFGNEVLPATDVNIACDSFGVGRDADELVIVLQCHANGTEFHIQIPGVSAQALNMGDPAAIGEPDGP